MRHDHSTIRKLLRGGSAPRPPGFIALGPPAGGAAPPVKKAASREAASAVWPPTAAQVASQRCPILPSARSIIAASLRRAKIYHHKIH
jgi:hypothetical protein